MLSDLLYRLRAILRRNTVEGELDDELRFHFDRQVEVYLRSGLTREEALRQARLAFGGLDQVKEECRQARGVSPIETTVQDLRYSLRGMRRSLLFTLVAVLTLALTTGAVSTVFHLAHALFFRQLPVEDPDEIVVVQVTRRNGAAQGWASYPDYVHFRDQSKTLEGLAAHYSTAPLFVTANSHSEEINGAVVSANFFPLLRVTPALGRFFRVDEDAAPDRDPVAVLSFDLWRDWFGSSPDALGAGVQINGVAFTVIGVAPAEFRGVSAYPSRIYIPTMMLRVGYRGCEDALAGDCPAVDMLGRLATGHTVEEAKAEVETLVPAAWAYAPEGENSGINVFRRQGFGRNESEVRLVELLGLASAVLLVVCCANLAGLLIARGAARSREFAIRASLGAARSRLVRQLMTESLVLALLGGILGTLASTAMTAAIDSMFYSLDAEGHPLYFDFSSEPVVLLAALAVSVAAGFLFGILPALKSSRCGPAESLKRHTTGSARSRSGRWLVGAQAAMAVALVAVAALLLASAHTLSTGANFESSQVALMRLRPRLLKYPPEKAQQFQRAVVRRLAEVPGVESVSMVGTGVVLSGGGAEVWLPEWAGPDRQAIHLGYIEVGPRYFETLRTPVLRGREFEEADSVNAPAVAIVNQTLASRLWPSGNVLGATVVLRGGPRRVVGIVADVPLENRTEPLKPYVYVPYWQNPVQVDARLSVRVARDPAAMLPALTREVNRVDPDVPIAETITLPLQMAGIFRPLRMSATVLSYAAGLAVLLCGMGLYGTLAFAVSRRTKEIGIRMAIGAQGREVLLLVVREGMAVIVVGVLAGLGLAAAGARLVEHLLLRAAGGDLWLYVSAGLLVLAAGLLACWLPARRAAGVEPWIALREE